MKWSRRWFQIRLSTLLLLVTAMCCVLGFVNWKVVRPAVARHRAVARIEALGGMVWYDWEYSDGFATNPNGRPPGPKWLRELIGDGRCGVFSRVFWVMIGDLDYPEATDDNFRALDTFKELRSLDIVGTGVSSAQMVHLAGLKDLRAICLHDSTVTDDALAHLEGLTDLTDLDLSGTNLSNSGMAHLQRLVGLTILDLTNTAVDDVGVEHLKKLTNLRILVLDRNQVSDVGLWQLAGLTNLTHLYLEDTQVSDAGLAHLKGLTNLTIVDVSGTQVTAAGVAELKKALRRVQVVAPLRSTTGGAISRR